MAYKTIMLDYEPVSVKMAAMVEEATNEMKDKGWKLVAFSVPNSARAILVFRISD